MALIIHPKMLIESVEAVVEIFKILTKTKMHVPNADALTLWANAQLLTTNVFGATKSTISRPSAT